MRPVLREMRDAFYRHTARWLESFGAGTWDPLAEPTIRQKTREGWPEPDRPLFASGDLFRSATSPTGPYSAQAETDHSITVLIDWANDGYQIPVVLSEGSPRGLPPRPIFELDDDYVAQAEHLLERRVIAAITTSDLSLPAAA